MAVTNSRVLAIDRQLSTVCARGTKQSTFMPGKSSKTNRLFFWNQVEGPRTRPLIMPIF